MRELPVGKFEGTHSSSGIVRGLLQVQGLPQFTEWCLLAFSQLSSPQPSLAFTPSGTTPKAAMPMDPCEWTLSRCLAPPRTIDQQLFSFTFAGSKVSWF